MRPAPAPEGARRVLLVGMMGAGKSTVGRLVANELGWPYVDSDEQVEAFTGRSVRELFEAGGEQAFRPLEQQALAAALDGDGPAVVSVAGGAVLSPANRALLRRAGTVVWLRASPDTLLRRILADADPAGDRGRGGADHRPLLGDDPAAALARLDAERRPVYQGVADVVVDVDELSPDAVAARVLEHVDAGPHAGLHAGLHAGPHAGPKTAPQGSRDRRRVITVPVFPPGVSGVSGADGTGGAGGAARSAYEVVVGAGASCELAALVARRAPGARQAAVVTDEVVAATGWFAGVDPGVPFEVHTVAAGERAKTLSSVEQLCRGFAAAGLARGDVVVAVGGGVVTDLAGYAAASYHRGVAYCTIATTLLGQVDAAIGGKTGVNLPEGKNLVGAFWQPAGVLCDTALLATLPEREWASGRGEMAKYTFLGEPALAMLTLEAQVARCVAVKAAFVAEDERETGRRVLLNYGHTLAHALEAAALDAGADLRHGEAVAVGLVYAALLARRLERIDEARVALHRETVRRFGLSDRLPSELEGVDVKELLAYMARDKKAAHDLALVLDGPRGVELVHGVAPHDALGALEELSCT
ncbi:MAG: bifunctional shikimate kinase/3-dehydroquinate synthase [Actinomycetota bacterium]|nr:bifunctional shikimate kinase/3-dehydroquinate synthase [Actinomycetota bacterium]